MTLILFIICHSVTYLPSIFLQLFYTSASFLPHLPPLPAPSTPLPVHQLKWPLKRSSCFYMMARQYDNDTVLHYVSSLLGMLWEHGTSLLPEEELAGEERCTTFEFKEMSKLSFQNAACRMMGQRFACVCKCARVFCERMCVLVFDW